VGTLESGLAALGIAPVRVTELAGDASHRRFFRVVLTGGATIVAALYQAGQEPQAERDHQVQLWGWERRLPIPRPLGWEGLVTASQDVGNDDLERAHAATDERVLTLALDTLAAFQGCELANLPTAPFDAAFLRAELAVFEEHALPAAVRGDPEVTAFLDRLAASLASHPLRLVHRDFHFNNLFLLGGTVWALDFQDMRGGPDTYDLASLLREREGASLVEAEHAWVARAATRFGWKAGWEGRYVECAAQRGLKVIGTFLRLAARGRAGYLRWLPGVCARAGAALATLSAPEKLREAVADPQGL
jgi:aminoglycoside/choline kinase family phosphotransferase